MLVDVVIPALNEEAALPSVLREIPRTLVRRVVVADNGSTDATAAVAREHLSKDPPSIVVFVDGDYSDHPSELPMLVDPIVKGHADLVIGSRARGRQQKGALSPQQRVGNAIACGALRLFYDVHYSDLGPFRAIRWETLRSLGMRDRNYGWTVEMQIKAARRGVRYHEVPVSYRRRIGVSKVSGTLRGSVGAGAKILWLLGRHAWR